MGQCPTSLQDDIGRSSSSKSDPSQAREISNDAARPASATGLGVPSSALVGKQICPMLAQSWSVRYERSTTRELWVAKLGSTKCRPRSVWIKKDHKKLIGADSFAQDIIHRHQRPKKIHIQNIPGAEPIR
jgi:hypothetical protein